jgi:hypothetical protein
VATPPAPREEPVRAEPVRAEPPRAAPARVEPARSQPARSEPARSEPAPKPVTERPVAEPAPRPVREPSSGTSPAPKSDGLTATVPREVIHTIVSSNVGVKRCFYDALKAGQIQKPITVNTTFNLSAAGSASNLRIGGSELQGSPLERCLDGAFRTMSFPPSAKGGEVSYPFKL